MSLRRLVLSDKSLAYAPLWTEADGEDAYTRIHVPVEIDGVVYSSLALSGGAYARLPDRHVTFELAFLDQASARRIRLARVDWRDRKGGHSNPRRCGGPWAGRRVPETHHHAFDLNFVEAEERMRRGKLPCAQPVEEPLQSFEDLSRWVGKAFRISNMHVVPPPPWSYDLFP
ncbi:hypothetical protein [Salinarimonas ramus]|uniref:Uncharacterized protein n=1 Tax=Salinarimonas ramus TaxID=690164 RepID=A0A917Q4W3_9HYPH|nr:hypothetical protein [Salinarimonas ramus]GGK21171.1 hypothetical protein GCM10011322_04770 [Salinarimonas ramus]